MIFNEINGAANDHPLIRLDDWNVLIINLKELN